MHEYDRLVDSLALDDMLADDDPLRLLILRGAHSSIRPPGSLPVVVAWVGDALGGDGPVAADLVISESELEALARNVEQRPIAAATLATLLRAQEGVAADVALALESAAYATLQAGPEFTAWRESTPSRTVDNAEPTVRVERDGGTLAIELDRPHRHNAITARMRDELHAALLVALTDDSIDHVELTGRGPSFCSGGDLAEFGNRPDPATAHMLRLTRSPARLLNRLSDRATVHLHGSTLGGGIELAAFARRVTADPNTRIGLPELGLGLIPGAGGTVSLPLRIGRQRTAALALAVDTIDGATAKRWGLVDSF